MSSLEQKQDETCRRFGAEFDGPVPESRVGVALRTIGQQPLNALRHTSQNGTCGWYLWWGEAWSDADDFFEPLHWEHLWERCPEILPYLALPPGWRVQLAPEHEDVWFDPELLKV
jgi:hypothetical protein